MPRYIVALDKDGRKELEDKLQTRPWSDAMFGMHGQYISFDAKSMALIPDLPRPIGFVGPFGEDA